MALGSADQRPAASPPDVPDFRTSFREHVFFLLLTGYAKVPAKEHSSSEEDVITEELKEAIDGYLQTPGAPDWVVHYNVTDQMKQSLPERHGKRRPTLDLVVGRNQAGPRPRLCFEAKRLYQNSGAPEYLGPEGLGAFLDGTYARTDPEAGMLGYVQTSIPAEWAVEIETRMSEDRECLRVSSDGDWRRETILAELRDTYRSRHERPTCGSPIVIYHLLLVFC